MKRSIILFVLLVSVILLTSCYNIGQINAYTKRSISEKVLEMKKGGFYTAKEANELIIKVMYAPDEHIIYRINYDYSRYRTAWMTGAPGSPEQDRAMIKESIQRMRARDARKRTRQ